MGNGAVRHKKEEAEEWKTTVPGDTSSVPQDVPQPRPNVDAADSNDATVDVARTFLLGHYGGCREAVQSLLETAAKACGGTVFFYSAPGGRGRTVVYHGCRSINDNGIFVLVACSSRKKSIIGESAPQHHLNALSRALENDGTTQPVVDVGTKTVAAIALRTRDANEIVRPDSLEGMLVVEVSADAGRNPRLGVGDRLGANLHMWSLLLKERIEKLRWEQDAASAAKALKNVLSSMEDFLQQEKLAMAMQSVCSLIPTPILTGGIESSRVGVWFRDGSDLVLNDTGHVDGARVPIDRSIVGYAVSTHADRVVVVPDVKSDSRHNKTLDAKTGFQTRSSICVPLPRPFQCHTKLRGGPEDGAVVQFIYGKFGWDQTLLQDAAATSKASKDAVDHFDVVVAERLPQSVLPTMLWLRDRILQIIAKEQERVTVEAIMHGLQFASTVVEVVEIVERDLADLVEAACCTVFFVDLDQGHVWAPPGDSETRPDGIVVAIGEGLAGHVAQMCTRTGGQSTGVLITNSPAKCAHWRGDDPNASFVTHNIMTAPVWSPGKDRQLLGIVQVLNKQIESKRRRGSMIEQSATQSNVGFGACDAKLLEAICAAIGHHLQRMLVDLMWTKTRMDTGMQEEAPSMLSEYYDAERVGTKPKNGAMLRQPSLAFDSLVPACTGDVNYVKIRGLGTLRFDTLTPEEHAEIGRWNIDYWALTEKDEFFMLIQALQQRGLMEDFNIDSRVLYNYFSQVKDGYNADVPYHNFNHAISTLHYTYKLLEAAEAFEYLYKNDLFAIMIAAICHDIGHRGRNNAFEVLTHSDLALRYNDSSPLENHHCARTFEIASGGKGDRNCNIFQTMPAETFHAIRKQLIAGILATDMRFHGDHVRVAQEFEPGTQTSQRQTLVEIFLHTADIANVCMPTNVAQRWNSLLGREFHEQAEEERARGIPVTPFMEGMMEPLTASKSCLGFMDFVVQPLLIPLVRKFPGLATVKEFMERNREENLNVINKMSVTQPTPSLRASVTAERRSLSRSS